jgi:hypothetical protein
MLQIADIFSNFLSHNNKYIILKVIILKFN